MTPQETLLDPFQLVEMNSKLFNPEKLTLNKKHPHQSHHLNCPTAQSEILIENIFMYRLMKAMNIFAWIRRVGLNWASLIYFMVMKHSIQRGSEKALKSTYISWNNFSDLVLLTSLKCLLSSHKKFNLTRLNKIKPWQQFLADSAHLYNGIMFSNYWPKRVLNWTNTCSPSDLWFCTVKDLWAALNGFLTEHTESYVGDIRNYRCLHHQLQTMLKTVERELG